ncbi:MAG: tetratricopeptide repeat protein [Candidatus Brocadiaceae bacterium]|nr:tetratricopeptide repeat protein [Candidatus Brocadiaceae bacterium]
MNTPNKTDKKKLDTKWIIAAIVVPIVVAGIGYLAICGNKHPDDATTLNNLAQLYRIQGKYEEAEPLYKRSLDILRRTFPNGHPNIDTIENNYAIMKQAMQSDQ